MYFNLILDNLHGLGCVPFWERLVTLILHNAFVQYVYEQEWKR